MTCLYVLQIYYFQISALSDVPPLIFTDFGIFLGEMLIKLSSPILLYLVRIEWQVMRMNLDMLILDAFGFNVTSYIAFSSKTSITAVFFFRKNSYVHGKTKKLI